MAVKVLQELTADQLVSFQDEAKSTSKLNHPNIIDVLDFGASPSGAPYMVMEYTKGENLDRWLRDAGHLSEDLAIHIAARIGDGLIAAHRQGIYHRDIKPSNILLVYAGDELPDVRLIDFGVAKAEETTGSVTEYQNRTLAGTPAYIPPDSILGIDYDARSEVYSMGCVLFEMLTGQPPFLGDTTLATIGMHVNNQAPLPSRVTPEISEEMDALVSRCLVKQPSDRLQSMEELQNGLDELQRVDAATHSTTTARESKRKNLPSPLEVGVGLALVLAGATALIPFIEMTNLSPETGHSSDRVKRSEYNGRSHFFRRCSI